MGLVIGLSVGIPCVAVLVGVVIGILIHNRKRKFNVQIENLGVEMDKTKGGNWKNNTAQKNKGTQWKEPEKKHERSHLKLTLLLQDFNF